MERALDIIDEIGKSIYKVELNIICKRIPKKEWSDMYAQISTAVDNTETWKARNMQRHQALRQRSYKMMNRLSICYGRPYWSR